MKTPIRQSPLAGKSHPTNVSVTMNHEPISSEYILHYCWKHRLLPKGELKTTRGLTVDVIDPGLQNRNAGPDFFNAKLKIDGVLWVGNVEIHNKATDWYTHGHNKDQAYNNVVLHIVRTADAEVTTENGSQLLQMEIDVPRQVQENYRELLQADRYPPCYKIVPSLNRITIHGWMTALQTERMEQKTQAIMQRVKRCEGDWEWAWFATLARSFGFGVNGDAFEQWAYSFKPSVAAHHRNDRFQIEALFMGQAGLLDTENIAEKHRQEMQADSYYKQLAAEYAYLAHKFGIQPIDGKQWKFMRMRPQNFPYIRIAQLVNLYCNHRTGLAALTDCASMDDIEQLLATNVTSYWEQHYTFGTASEQRQKHLSEASLQLIAINAAAPMLFAYGRHKTDEQLCDKALILLEQIKAEKNHIVEMWKACGLDAQTAGDSQGLIQLKREYCDKKDCLRCRFGYEYLKQSPVKAAGIQP